MKRIIIAAVAFSATTLTYAQSTINASEAPAAPVETAAPVKVNESAPATEAEPIEAVAIDSAANQQAAPTAEDRKPVKISDLPAPVTKALGNTEYNGWTPSTAYWVTEKTGNPYYEINLLRGDEKKIVYYNAEGSKLEGTKVED